MRHVLIFVLVLMVTTAAIADDRKVKGYTRSDGTHVDGYHRSSSDGTVNNNYGTQGNKNPYTGSDGTKPRNPYQGSGNYNSGNGEGY